MKIKDMKVYERRLEDQSTMFRVLMIFDNDSQVSFWLGAKGDHAHIVEILLSAASDIVYKVSSNESNQP